MIIVKINGLLPKQYGEEFFDCRFVFKDFKAMRDEFTAQIEQDYYGVSRIEILDLYGATYDEMIENRNYLESLGYSFGLKIDNEYRD